MSEYKKEFSLENEVEEMNIKIAMAINPLSIETLPIAVVSLELYVGALKKDSHFSDTAYQYLKSLIVPATITTAGDEETLKALVKVLKEGTL